MLNLSKHDWKSERFVWEKKPGEAPAPAPAGTPPAPARTPEQEAAAREAMEKQRIAAATAARRTDQAGEQADAALDAELGGGGAAAQAPAAPGETPEFAETKLRAKYQEKLKAIQDLVGTNKGEEAERKIGELYASLEPAERLLLSQIVPTQFTDQEKADFIKAYTKEDKLDTAAIEQKIREGALKPREYYMASQIIKEEKEKQKPAYSFEEIQAAFAKPDHKEAYGQFLKDQNTAKFLESIPDPEDKKKIKWAVEAEATEIEKKALADELKDTFPKTPEELAAKLEKGELDYRRGKVCKGILDDLQKASEGESLIPDSVKGLGFMAILEKLIDQLSKLAEKISGALEKAFAKKDQPSEKPRFAKSPLGEENGNPKKFIIARIYESGKGMEIATPPNTPIFAVGSGTIKDLGNNKIELVADNGRKVVYQNVIIELGANNKKVDSGEKIGKTGPLQTLTLQYFNEKAVEDDPEPLLAAFITTQPAPSPTTTAPPSPAPKTAETPAPAPAPSTT